MPGRGSRGDCAGLVNGSIMTAKPPSGVTAMDPRIAAAAFLLAGAVALPGLAWAQPAAAPVEHPIPQSLQLGHTLTLEYLATLSQRPGPVGVEAGKLRALFQAHMAKENEFILPPLVLLPALARGQATPDMKWAIPMSDRVKAEQEDIFRSHIAVMEQAVALENAADNAGDESVRDWVRGAIIDDLADLELMEPMSALVGDLLRARLPAQ